MDDDGEAKERSDGARSLEEVRRDASEARARVSEDARTGDAGRREVNDAPRLGFASRGGRGRAPTNAEGEERE